MEIMEIADVKVEIWTMLLSMLLRMGSCWKKIISTQQKAAQSINVSGTKKKVKATIIDFYDVPQTNEDLVKAISQQPVSVAINASPVRLYRSGVYNNWKECGAQLNHGVLAVGYGQTQDGQKYWIVKNSWGQLWGD